MLHDLLYLIHAKPTHWIEWDIKLFNYFYVNLSIILTMTYVKTYYIAALNNVFISKYMYIFLLVIFDQIFPEKSELLVECIYIFFYFFILHDICTFLFECMLFLKVLYVFMYDLKKK